VLFYNHKQEFIGIDEEGLRLLNYATLEDLLKVCSDVADLFTKEPGYIHKFKSFGWINFLLHADSDTRSAIVHGNGRIFSCTLQVNSLFLTANPSENGYIIDMLHIQTISGDEMKLQRPVSKAKFDPIPIVLETQIEPDPSILPNDDHITQSPPVEPSILDFPSNNGLNVTDEPLDDLYAKLSLPLSDEELGKEFFIPESSDSFELEIAPNIVDRSKPKINRPIFGDIKYSKEEKEFIDTLKVDISYQFDPSIAAKELGLPVDLIQEFIGDFIQQADEFKEEFFESALKGDINNLKILSHKLKGVAANLRIEDAFETLNIINTSNDSIEIEANLKYFYSIIEKLRRKKPVSQPVNLIADDEIYSFTLKESEPSVIYEEELYPTTNLDEELIIESIEETLDEIPSAEINHLLHYDKVFISGQLGIEHDFFDELIDEYKHDALRAGQEIKAAIEAFDTHVWRKTALQLKGISDNLRLNEISDQLAILSQTNDAQEANKASKILNSFLEQL
jgi:HPt (histidine-containing phosphotransfer) domain-containing protein